MVTLNTLDDTPIKEMLFAENNDLKAPSKTTAIERIQESRNTHKSRRQYPLSIDAPTILPTPFFKENKIPLASPDSIDSLSQEQLIAKFMIRLEEIQSACIEITDRRIQASLESIQKNALASSAKEREIESADKKNSSWKNSAELASRVTGIASVALGLILLSQGALFPALAGAGLVLTGLTSLSAAVFDQSQVSTHLTTGAGIALGTIGLIAGGSSVLAMGIHIPAAMNIGMIMLNTATSSARAVASIYQKKSLEHRAHSTKIDSALALGRDQLQSTSKFISHVADNYAQNTENIIRAIEAEKDALEKMIKIQLPMRG